MDEVTRLAAQICLAPELAENGLTALCELTPEQFTRAQLEASHGSKDANVVHLERFCTSRLMRDTASAVLERRVRTLVIAYGLVEERHVDLDRFLFGALSGQIRLDELRFYGRDCLDAYGVTEADVERWFAAMPSLAECVSAGQFKRLCGLPAHGVWLRSIMRIKPKLVPRRLEFCTTGAEHRASAIGTLRFLRWCRRRGIEETIETRELRIGFKNLDK